jgi:hypothetical protein
MWHQGMLLTAEFPSYALVAMGGCIEELSRAAAFRDQLGRPPVACPECGNVPLAEHTFWQTVSLVASPDEIRQLRKDWDVYTKRSKTAHGAALHGFERHFGALIYLRYVPPTDAGRRRSVVDESDPAQVFTLRTLPTTWNIAARLLYRALNAPGP